MTKRVAAGVLDVAYEEAGAAERPVIILLHGFPYDVRAYDDVMPRLAEAGYRVIVPYLRGFGPTRFLSEETPRSGQQAALALDLLALMDALSIKRATLGGYDWGGRAACIVAALWPARVRGLVSVNGYNIQDIASSGVPETPENEYRYWYQYYFHGERGRAGLTLHRYQLCRLLWTLWSPHWAFDEATYQRTALSFDNPDFVDVVIHSYRHRYGLVAGDPAADEVEQRLAGQPLINVPAVVLDGQADGVMPLGGTEHHERFFTSSFTYLSVPRIGHNLPQEAPGVFVDAILTLA